MSPTWKELQSKRERQAGDSAGLAPSGSYTPLPAAAVPLRQAPPPPGVRPPVSPLYWDGVAWWVGLVSVLLLAVGVFLQLAHGSVDQLFPKTGMARTQIMAALGLLAAAATCLGFCKLEKHHLVSLGLGLLLGIPTGLAMGDAIEFVPDTSLGDSSFFPVLLIGIGQLPLTLVLLGTSLPKRERGRYARVAGLIGVGAIALLVGLFAALGSYMLANMDRLAREAHEAHLHDTPAMGLVGALAALLLVAHQIHRRRNPRKADP